MILKSKHFLLLRSFVFAHLLSVVNAHRQTQKETESKKVVTHARTSIFFSHQSQVKKISIPMNRIVRSFKKGQLVSWSTIGQKTNYFIFHIAHGSLFASKYFYQINQNVMSEKSSRTKKKEWPCHTLKS